MRRRLPFLLVILTGVILVGCDGSRHVKKGDAWMLSDEPARALTAYRKALEKKTELSEDPEFLGKLRSARGGVLYHQARTLMEKERWDDAVDRLNESLQADSDSERAQRALTQARKEPSGMHYRRAL